MPPDAHQWLVADTVVGPFIAGSVHDEAVVAARRVAVLAHMRAVCGLPQPSQAGAG